MHSINIFNLGNMEDTSLARGRFFNKRFFLFLSYLWSPSEKTAGRSGGRGAAQKTIVEKSGLTMEPTAGRWHGRRANFHRGPIGIGREIGDAWVREINQQG